MEIWIKQEKEEVRLPVLPASFQIKTLQKNQTININQLGEVNLFGNRGLKETSISSFFPLREYDDSIVEYSGYKKPYDYANRIEQWKEKGICKLIITGVLTMWCTIEEFEYSEKDGTGDVYYTIHLKEYIKISIQKASTNTSVNATTKKIELPQTARQVKAIHTTTYIVKKGDTLMAIAKKFTGSSANYIAIANQNKIKNPNLIYIGQKLVITIWN